MGLVARRVWPLVAVVVLCGVCAVDSVNPDAVRRYLQREATNMASLYLPVSVSPTSPCGQALIKMANSLNENSTWWAVTMVDAWGKNNDGMIVGNGASHYLGNYDECLAAASPDGTVMGKYCMIYTELIELSRKQPTLQTFTPPAFQAPWMPDLSRLNKMAVKEPRTLPSQVAVRGLTHATCMPNVCTKEELSESLMKTLLPQGSYGGVISCHEKNEEIEYQVDDAGFMALVTFLLTMIVCASLVDIYLDYTNNTQLRKGVLQYLLVFSAYTNLGKMMQVNPKSSPGNITCLHALRVLSMTWVIYCHQQTIPLIVMSDVIEMLLSFDGIMAQAIFNGYPSVDTFFFLSGLLVAYSILREVKRTGKLNVIVYFFHRLIRLIPPIGIVAGFVATTMRVFVSGPYAFIWDLSWKPNCQKYWWKDILFVSNFYYDDGDCIGQTWYLGVDMQLYLVAPIIILPLYFKPAFGKAWLFILTAFSAIIPAAIIYEGNLPPTLLMGAANSDAYFKKIYTTPWARAEPWIAGAWLGYILYRQGNRRIKMSALVVTTGWTLASITGLLVVYGMYSYNKLLGGVKWEVMTQVVYGGGHRLAWGAALAWVVFACYNGYGGVVNDFMSHPVWQPISRLTYSTYLVAFPMQYFISYCFKSTYYFTHVNMVISTVGALIISLPVAVLVSLMVESPIMGLEKLLLRPERSSPLPKPASEIKTDPHQPSSPPESPLKEEDPTTPGICNPVFTMEEGDAGSDGVKMRNIDQAVNGFAPSPTAITSKM